MTPSQTQARKTLSRLGSTQNYPATGRRYVLPIVVTEKYWEMKGERTV